MSNIVTINFRNDLLFAADRGDAVYVAIKPICEGLGLTWQGQLERLRRDTILSEGLSTMAIPSPGGSQDTTCLRLDLLHGWLFTIDDKRVKGEVRERVLAYKRDCYAVLYNYFYGKAGDQVDPEPTFGGSGMQFPMWPMEELRTKRTVVDMYRMLFGLAGAQWMSQLLGFPIPPIAQLAGDDAIGRFLAARTRIVPGARVQSAVLYRAYVAWATEHREGAVTQTMFSRLLHRRGMVAQKGNVVMWQNLELFDVAEVLAA